MGKIVSRGAMLAGAVLVALMMFATAAFADQYPPGPDEREREAPAEREAALARTGTDISWIAVLGGVVLIVGAGTVLYARRRRVAELEG
jgi:LPXTG-motif cell wall-anchored protein